jgi:hypothetical protein
VNANARAAARRRAAAKAPAAEDEQVPHALRDYALLADGERGILVGPRGEFAWMCFPGWESEAIFSSLIGGLGVFSIAPLERYVWGGYYEEGTLIWHSRWVTVSGAIVECREALALPASRSRAIVLRRVSVLEGEARLRVILHPRHGFGEQPLRRLRRREAGVWLGRTGDVHCAFVGAEAALDRPDGRRGRLLEFELVLAEGQQYDFMLTLASSAAELDTLPAAACWSATEAAWEERIPSLPQVAGRRDARHAYAVLDGMTSAGGGMVAAATTSLPERAREGRNYDYRYVWIRDQCYAGCAIARAGPYPLLDDAVRFVRDRLLEHGPDLRPAYTASGGRVPDERRLDLPGYPGGFDIVGNWVNDQFQLDIFGESLELLAAACRHDRLDADGWRAAELAVAAIERRWREPDAGIWELEPDGWTHSRLACAAGLRSIAACSPAAEQAARWLALADVITAETSARALHTSGRWQRSERDERIDGALLLPGIRGAIAPDDPRTVATLHAVQAELTEDGYVYRFRPDARPLGEAEGAFLVCGFLMALALAGQGDHVGAARWFERNRAACGPPGLLAEEFDVAQRQLRGNLPQAFVHALLLECAVEQAGFSDPDLAGSAAEVPPAP